MSEKFVSKEDRGSGDMDIHVDFDFMKREMDRLLEKAPKGDERALADFLKAEMGKIYEKALRREDKKKVMVDSINRLSVGVLERVSDLERLKKYEELDRLLTPRLEYIKKRALKVQEIFGNKAAVDAVSKSRVERVIGKVMDDFRELEELLMADIRGAYARLKAIHAGPDGLGTARGRRAEEIMTFLETTVPLALGNDARSNNNTENGQSLGGSMTMTFDVRLDQDSVPGMDYIDSLKDKAGVYDTPTIDSAQELDTYGHWSTRGVYRCFWTNEGGFTPFPMGIPPEKAVNLMRPWEYLSGEPVGADFDYSGYVSALVRMLLGEGSDGAFELDSGARRPISEHLLGKLREGAERLFVTRENSAEERAVGDRSMAAKMLDLRSPSKEAMRVAWEKCRPLVSAEDMNTFGLSGRGFWLDHVNKIFRLDHFGNVVSVLAMRDAMAGCSFVPTLRLKKGGLSAVFRNPQTGFLDTNWRVVSNVFSKLKKTPEVLSPVSYVRRKTPLYLLTDPEYFQSGLRKAQAIRCLKSGLMGLEPLTSMIGRDAQQLRGAYKLIDHEFLNRYEVQVSIDAFCNGIQAVANGPGYDVTHMSLIPLSLPEVSASGVQVLSNDPSAQAEAIKRKAVGLLNGYLTSRGLTAIPIEEVPSGGVEGVSKKTLPFLNPEHTHPTRGGSFCPPDRDNSHLRGSHRNQYRSTKNDGAPASPPPGNRVTLGCQLERDDMGMNREDTGLPQDDETVFLGHRSGNGLAERSPYVGKGLRMVNRMDEIGETQVLGAKMK